MKNETCREKLKEMSQSSRYGTSAKFRLAGNMLRRVMEKKAAVTGVYRSQHQLLMTLFFRQDISQAALAGHMDISPAAVAVTLKKLEKGGYITRENRENDNRANKIVITQKGHETIYRSIELFEEIDKGMFEGFSEEDIAAFSGYLDRIHENLLTQMKREEQ